MRNLTDEEIKAIVPHFDTIAAQYKKLGESRTTDEFKKNMLHLIKISDEQPLALRKLWSSCFIEIVNWSS